MAGAIHDDAFRNAAERREAERLLRRLEALALQVERLRTKKPPKPKVKVRRRADLADGQ